MKFLTCPYCKRNKSFNHTYGMCEDCLKSSAKKYGLNVCDYCNGSASLCFCGSGFMKKITLEEMKGGIKENGRL